MEKEITIFEAIGQDNIELIKQILSKKPNLRVYDPSSYEDTPLHLAIRNNKNEIAKLLIENGAPVEARNKFDDTPLHLAAISGNFQAVKMLIDASADLNTKNDNNKTALNLAKEYNHKDIVSLIEKLEN